MIEATEPVLKIIKKMDNISYRKDILFWISYKLLLWRIIIFDNFSAHFEIDLLKCIQLWTLDLLDLHELVLIKRPRKQSLIWYL